MKATISKSALNKAIAQCAAIVDPRASHASLQRLHMQITGGRLRITGSNGFVTIRASVEVSNALSGTCCVDTKLAKELFSSLPGASAEVSIEVAGSTMKIKCGARRSEIDALLGDDYPDLPIGTDALVPIAAASLSHALSRVAHACGDDVSRPEISGVNIKCADGQMIAQATDGNRGATIGIECKTGAFSCLLPVAALASARKLISDAGTGEVEIGADTDHVRLRCGSSEMVARMTGATFPPIERVTPKDSASPVNVDRGMLLDAVRGMSPTALHETSDGKTKWGEVEITFADGQIRIAAVNVRGKSFDEVECDYAGDTIGMTLRPSLLIDALASETADEVSLHVTSPVEPLKITPRLTRESTYLIMPMRGRAA